MKSKINLINKKTNKYYFTYNYFYQIYHMDYWMQQNNSIFKQT